MNVAWRQEWVWCEWKCGRGGAEDMYVRTHPGTSIVQRTAEGHILVNVLPATAYVIVKPCVGHVVAALNAQQGNNLTTTTHTVSIARSDHTPTAGDINRLNVGGISTTGRSRSNSGHPIGSLTTDRAIGH